MTLPSAANDAAHLQQTHQQGCGNYESRSAKFADALALEIDRAPIQHLDYLARQVWSAHANGIIDDDAAQSLAEQLADRQRGRGRPRPGPKNAPAAIPVP